MTMRTTFDTNTLDKAVRPARFPKDPAQPDYEKVNEALIAGTLRGFFSETMITLEGIQKKDRASVFQSTQLSQQPEEDISVDGSGTAITVRMAVEQPARRDLHPETVARLTEATNIGLKVLRAPRIGMLYITDPDGKYFVEETDADRGNRITVYGNLLKEIEKRGIGFAVGKALGTEFGRRAGVTEPWFHSLVRATDVHEENEVKRAIAEWADGDSIAAHIGYGIDFFCSNDAGKSAGAPSVLDQANRAWLTATYGVRFVTISELAKMI